MCWTVRTQILQGNVLMVYYSLPQLHVMLLIWSQVIFIIKCLSVKIKMQCTMIVPNLNSRLYLWNKHIMMNISEAHIA